MRNGNGRKHTNYNRDNQQQDQGYGNEARTVMEEGSTQHKGQRPQDGTGYKHGNRFKEAKRGGFGRHGLSNHGRHSNEENNSTQDEFQDKNEGRGNGFKMRQGNGGKCGQCQYRAFYEEQHAKL